MPEIYYILNSVKKRYYPDCYIKNKNIIVEVKSEYTFTSEIEKNYNKFAATLQLNYELLFLMFDQFGKLLELVNLHNLEELNHHHMFQQ